MIPFLDLKAAYDELAPVLEPAILRATRAGWYIGGEEVALFEAQFATYVGANHCVGLGNGLDALTLALRALDIGPGDEVIVPSHTYIATWLAVSAVGATIVPVEPAIGDYVVTADDMAQKLTPRTKVLLPVHLYGMPADMDAIMALAQKHGLWVVEDAAQAHGVKVRGTPIGSHGQVVAWSFYPGKNLGALGDGGAITTNDANIAARIRRLGNYGSDKKYYNDEIGVNSRLDPLQAAALGAKLTVLDDWNNRRQALVARYQTGLQGLPLSLPRHPTWADPAWHLYVVATEARDALQHYLQLQGVQTLIHYPVPPHLQAAYRPLGMATGSLPVAEAYAKNVLSLPLGPQLTVDAVDQVVSHIRDFFALSH